MDSGQKKSLLLLIIQHRICKLNLCVRYLLAKKNIEKKKENLLEKKGFILQSLKPIHSPFNTIKLKNTQKMKKKKITLNEWVQEEEEPYDR